MRTSDRTYSQKLGFDDKDRHDQIHNAAAVYLCQPEKIEKLVAVISKLPFVSAVARISLPIVQRGSNDFQRIIGYPDLTVITRVDGGGYHPEIAILVEIKKGYVDVNTVLQQMDTYRLYFRNYQDQAFIVCTMFKVTATYKAILRESGYHHIYVSEDDVTKFLDAQKEFDSPSF